MGSSPISATIGPLVKRSRHRPFTAVTGVRFSHGSPTNKNLPIGRFFCLLRILRAIRCNVFRVCEANCRSSGRQEKSCGLDEQSESTSLLPRVTNNKEGVRKCSFFVVDNSSPSRAPHIREDMIGASGKVTPRKRVIPARASSDSPTGHHQTKTCQAAGFFVC